MLNNLLEHGTETNCKEKKCVMCNKPAKENEQRNFGADMICVSCFIFDEGGN